MSCHPPTWPNYIDGLKPEIKRFASVYNETLGRWGTVTGREGDTVTVEYDGDPLNPDGSARTTNCHVSHLIHQRDFPAQPPANRRV